MKRFYKAVGTTDGPDGYGVALDGRAIQTPGKRPVLLPNAGVAEALAEEWAAQAEEIVLAEMGLNRLVNIAIDRVAHERDYVIREIAGYGDADLLCYRAEEPEELIARQTAAWDPLLAWADRRYGVRLELTSGITHVAQAADSMAVLREAVAGQDDFALSALHSAVGISGSLIVGLALADGHLDPDAAWQIAQIDEDWQTEKWGEDEEAGIRRADAFAGLRHAHALMCLLRE